MSPKDLSQDEVKKEQNLFSLAAQLGLENISECIGSKWEMNTLNSDPAKPEKPFSQLT